MCTQELLKLELFQVLSPERLDWVCDRAEAIELKAQEVLVREGDAALGFLILTEGRIGVTRYSDGVGNAHRTAPSTSIFWRNADSYR